MPTEESVRESDVKLEGDLNCYIKLNGEVVGRIEGYDGKIQHIDISDEHQRKGIGSIAVKKWIRQQESTVIETSTVLSTESELFWRSLGFEPKDSEENIFIYRKSRRNPRL